MSLEKKIEKRRTGRPTKMPDGQYLLNLYGYFTAKQLSEMFSVKEGTVRSWVCRVRKENEING